MGAAEDLRPLAQTLKPRPLKVVRRQILLSPAFRQKGGALSALAELEVSEQFDFGEETYVPASSSQTSQGP